MSQEAQRKKHWSEQKSFPKCSFQKLHQPFLRQPFGTVRPFSPPPAGSALSGAVAEAEEDLRLCQEIAEKNISSTRELGSSNRAMHELNDFERVVFLFFFWLSLFCICGWVLVCFVGVFVLQKSLGRLPLKLTTTFYGKSEQKQLIIGFLLWSLKR